MVRPHLTIAVRRGRDTMLEDLLTGPLRKESRLEKGSSDTNLNITPSLRSSEVRVIDYLYSELPGD